MKWGRDGHGGEGIIGSRFVDIVDTILFENPKTSSAK
jgi:hypothetical protein